jgi:hypothetical protein
MTLVQKDECLVESLNIYLLLLIFAAKDFFQNYFWALPLGYAKLVLLMHCDLFTCQLFLYFDLHRIGWKTQRYPLLCFVPTHLYTFAENFTFKHLDIHILWFSSSTIASSKHFLLVFSLALAYYLVKIWHTLSYPIITWLRFGIHFHIPLLLG